MTRYLIIAGFVLSFTASMAHAQTEADVAAPEAVQAEQPMAPVPEPVVDTVIVTTQDQSYQSIMFNQNEIARIDPIISMVVNNQPLPTDGTAAGTSTAQVAPEVDYVFPQFYLSSIVFDRGGRWSIWVNNERLSTEAPKSGALEVLSVTPSQAELRYSFTLEDRNDFDNKPASSRVSLDPFNRTATFILQTNQTFSSYNWRIYEGKVQPAVMKAPEKNSSLLNLPDIKNIFNSPSTPIPADGEAKSSGIKGVMDTYKNIDNKAAP